MKRYNATQIIESAHRATTQDGYTSYPALADELEKRIRELCADLQLLTGQSAIATPGCDTTTVVLGDLDVLVEYEYDAGERGCHTLPNGDPGWPEIPPTVMLVSLFLNGKWIAPADILSQDRIEKIEQEIMEQIADKARADDGEYWAAREE